VSWTEDHYLLIPDGNYPARLDELTPVEGKGENACLKAKWSFLGCDRVVFQMVPMPHWVQEPSIREAKTQITVEWFRSVGVDAHEGDIAIPAAIDALIRQAIGSRRTIRVRSGHWKGASFNRGAAILS